MSGSDSDKDSVTEVAEESFVRERPLEIERGAVLAGRYQVEEVIGKGGSGVVLRVFDRTVQNVVALKVLKSELARDAKWDKRFSRELRLGRPIQNPNVCRIFDIGEADGHRFLTMELATGGSLRDELKRRPALERPVAERLADARAAIGGLAAIHGAGVVHRDFKPDNLLRMEDGRLVISDFGLATDAATAAGVTVMIGTPHYMAPEVLAGEPATTRSDVWALGVVIHEIFFGRRPERKTTSFDGSGRGPIRPETALERFVLDLCERCLCDAAAERPADAREVSGLLSEALERLQRSTGSPRRWLTLSLGVAAVGIVAAGAWVRTSRRRAQPAPANAVNASNLRVTGEAQDWSKSASIVARFAGAIQCLSPRDERNVTVVWGWPRQATDVDVETGQTMRADLVPDSFSASCPDRSAKTNQLLYAARNAAGAMEVRLSGRPDGAGAVPVTSGEDPRWLGTSDAFLYKVDEFHVGVFSLPTMQLRLLAGRETSRMQEVGEEAVSRTGDLIALTGYDETAGAWIEVFRRQGERRIAEFTVPWGSRITFGWRDSEILVAGQTFEPELSVAALDLQSGSLRRVGRVPGMDLTRVLPLGSRAVFVTRRRSLDAWSYQHGVRTRVTSDGNVAFASLSPSGEILLSKRAEDGTLNIWLRSPNGSEQKVTSGTKDATPSFSPDGQAWAYADYANGTIRICERAAHCQTLAFNGELPGVPTIAPGNQRIAFATEVGGARMKVVDRGGRVIAQWDALPVCGGVWSSDNRVWSVEKLRGTYYWAEHDALTGESTGQRVRLLNEDFGESGTVDCRAEGAVPGSVLFRPVQAEEDESSMVWTSTRQRLGL